ncbi:tetratricopeptide repeat protein [Desulforudis sp. 1031]|uniref:tetratricopeptide repeat protein n=1 Tax=unclassified Candidatus Desulforudis TaxID=2635950 RepID=UPI003CE45284
MKSNFRARKDRMDKMTDVYLKSPRTVSPPGERELLLRRAADAGSRGDWREMERALRTAVEVDENCQEAWFALGMLVLQRGDMEEAYDFLSEYAALAGQTSENEQVEVLLYYLENLANPGGGIGEELESEMAGQFLDYFTLGCGTSDQRQAMLGGRTLWEAVHTPSGRRSVLTLLRRKNLFARLALERLSSSLAML